MIGIITLLFAGLWLLIAKGITKLVQRLDVCKRSAFLSAMCFPAIVALPFTDEIIGRIQYEYLCATETKVYIAPNIKDIKAARRGIDSDYSYRSWYLIPVKEQVISYLDAMTGETIYSVNAFHTPGGWIMRAGLNLGNSSSCWPDKWYPMQNGFNIDEMLEMGKKIETK